MCCQTTDYLQKPAAFYKYTESGTTEAVLSSGALRWSAPTRFNDAFDVTRILEFKYDDQQLAHALRDEICQLLASGAQDPPYATAEVKAHYARFRELVAQGKNTFEECARMARETFVDGLPNPFNAVQFVQDHWDGVVKKLRILCMSTKPDSPQMWAYYADELRGVVLEFVPHPNHALGKLEPVIYSDVVPPLLPLRDFAREMLGFTRGAYQRCFKAHERTKTCVWAHENEWRVVGVTDPDDANDFSDYPFYPAELRRVIYGPHMRDPARRAIATLLEQPRWRHVQQASVRINHRTRQFELLNHDVN
jgi:hypothetical protein